MVPIAALWASLPSRLLAPDFLPSLHGFLGLALAFWGTLVLSEQGPWEPEGED